MVNVPGYVRLHPHSPVSVCLHERIGRKGVPAPARTVRMLPGDMGACIKFGVDILNGRVTEPATPRGRGLTHRSRAGGFGYVHR